MPYKDPEKQREANRERIRRYRDKQKGVTSDVVCNTLDVTPQAQGITKTSVTPCNPLVIPETWQVVRDFISRPTEGMSNLEKLQRIAGSLGRNADEVWFGLMGLTMGDIGRVIGMQEAKY